MASLGYTYGFRKSELLNLLKVGQLDLLARTVRLNPGDAKNGEGRTVTLTKTCYLLVVELMRGKRPEDFSLTATTS